MCKVQEIRQATHDLVVGTGSLEESDGALRSSGNDGVIPYPRAEKEKKPVRIPPEDNRGHHPLGRPTASERRPTPIRSFDRHEGPLNDFHRGALNPCLVAYTTGWGHYSLGGCNRGKNPQDRWHKQIDQGC